VGREAPAKEAPPQEDLAHAGADHSGPLTVNATAHANQRTTDDGADHSTANARANPAASTHPDADADACANPAARAYPDTDTDNPAANAGADAPADRRPGHAELPRSRAVQRVGLRPLGRGGIVGPGSRLRGWTAVVPGGPGGQSGPVDRVAGTAGADRV
jgi:hypothetical protein